MICHVIRKTETKHAGATRSSVKIMFVTRIVKYNGGDHTVSENVPLKHNLSPRTELSL